MQQWITCLAVVSLNFLIIFFMLRQWKNNLMSDADEKYVRKDQMQEDMILFKKNVCEYNEGCREIIIDELKNYQKTENLHMTAPKDKKKKKEKKGKK